MRGTIKNNRSTIAIHLHILYCCLTAEQGRPDIYLENGSIVFIVEILQRCCIRNASIVEETVYFAKPFVSFTKQFHTIRDLSKICVNKDTVPSRFANLFQGLVGCLFITSANNYASSLFGTFYNHSLTNTLCPAGYDD